MRFGLRLTVSYSFKQTSNSAFFFVLQNVSKSKKCQLVSTVHEHNDTYVKTYLLTLPLGLCVSVYVSVCTQTLLRASTLSRHTPQANSLAFLMPCLRMQEEKSRELSSGCTDARTRTHTHTHLDSSRRVKCSHFCSYNNSTENKHAYSKHLQASSTFHKDSA